MVDRKRIRKKPSRRRASRACAVPTAVARSDGDVVEVRDDVRVISADDIMSGRVRERMGLETEEEGNERNELVDSVYAEQRKLGWPGL